MVYRTVAKSISFAAAEAPRHKAELMNATGRKETNENVATPRAVVKKTGGRRPALSLTDAPVNPATSVPMAIKLASNIGQPAKTYRTEENLQRLGQNPIPL